MSLTSCEKHSDCVIVYDDYSNSHTKGRCPYCRLVEQLEEKTDMINQDMDDLADLKKEISVLKEEIDELKGPSERGD